MNPEHAPWDQLRAHAAARLRPGFADRVIRAAREGAAAAPSILSQFALSAVTAGLCYVAVALFNGLGASSQDHLADWQEIASATVADSGLAP